MAHKVLVPVRETLTCYVQVQGATEAIDRGDFYRAGRYLLPETLAVTWRRDAREVDWALSKVVVSGPTRLSGGEYKGKEAEHSVWLSRLPGHGELSSFVEATRP